MNEQNNFDRNNEELKNQNESKSDSTLFGETEAPAPINKGKKKTYTQKALLVTYIFVALAIIGILVYLFVAEPWVKEEQEANETTSIVTPVETIEGEARGENQSLLLMFPELERADISSIAVKNDFDEYAFIYDKTSNSFYISGYPTAPLDSEIFSYFITYAALYPSVEERTQTGDIDWATYGLTEDTIQGQYTVKLNNSKTTHTVYIGNMTPAGTGYYARYVGRDALYVVSQELGSYITTTVESYITPQVSIPLSGNNYTDFSDFAYLDNSLPDDEKIRLYIKYNAEALKDDLALSPFELKVPSGYTLNTSSYEAVLTVLVDFKGESTLVYDPSEEELDLFGLLEPRYQLYFVLKGDSLKEYGISDPDNEGLQMIVDVSEKNANGNYYVYSPLFGLITEISGDSLKWLEWGDKEWVDKPVFMMNIKYVKSISIKSEENERIFDITHLSDGKNITVKERLTGTEINDSLFRSLYQLLLYVYIQDYAPAEDIAATDVSEDKAYLTFTVETLSGDKKEYRFYPYSTRKALVTANGGKPEFYVLRDKVKKIIDDTEHLMKGEEFDPTARS